MLTKDKEEIAARKLCELRGIDPDKNVGHGYDPSPGETYIPDVMLYSPAWTRVLQEIRAQDQISEALNYAQHTS